MVRRQWKHSHSAPLGRREVLVTSRTPYEFAGPSNSDLQDENKSTWIRGTCCTMAKWQGHAYTFSNIPNLQQKFCTLYHNVLLQDYIPVIWYPCHSFGTGTNRLGALAGSLPVRSPPGRALVLTLAFYSSNIAKNRKKRKHPRVVQKRKGILHRHQEKVEIQEEMFPFCEDD